MSQGEVREGREGEMLRVKVLGCAVSLCPAIKARCG